MPLRVVHGARCTCTAHTHRCRSKKIWPGCQCPLNIYSESAKSTGKPAVIDIDSGWKNETWFGLFSHFFYIFRVDFSSTARTSAMFHDNSFLHSHLFSIYYYIIFRIFPLCHRMARLWQMPYFTKVMHCIFALTMMRSVCILVQFLCMWQCWCSVIIICWFFRERKMKRLKNRTFIPRCNCIRAPVNLRIMVSLRMRFQLNKNW